MSIASFVAISNYGNEELHQCLSNPEVCVGQILLLCQGFITLALDLFSAWECTFNSWCLNYSSFYDKLQQEFWTSNILHKFCQDISKLFTFNESKCSSIHSSTFRNTMLKNIVTVTKADKKNWNSTIPRDLKRHIPYVEGSFVCMFPIFHLFHHTWCNVSYCYY